jgi:C-terminal processing protease CtpA/Prc
MVLRRTLLSSTLALALFGCGGGGSNNNAAPISSAPTPTPTPTPTTSAIQEQLGFAEAVLNEWYLFPDLLDTSVDTADFDNVQDYLDARVAPARAQGIDRGFTFATSIEEEQALINSGSSGGSFGIRLAYDTVNDRVFVLEAFENGNAFKAGMDRGTELLGIATPGQNEQLVSSLMATGGPQAVADALGPGDEGVTRTLRFAQAGGAVITQDITKTDFSLDPVSDRYGALTITDGSAQVGYINLRTFIIADAADQLREAFAGFQASGITELIIDFRYNGGGLVDVADTFGDLLNDGREGEVWSETEVRPERVEDFEDSGGVRFRNLQTEPNAIRATRIAFIARGGTASASELVINAMLPYLDPANIALIGADTFGKPVGQFAFDLDGFDLRVRPVSFKTNNADGDGEYFTGLASVIPNTCRAGDDIFSPLGDPAEESIAQALSFLRGEPCNAISGGGIEAQSVRRRAILQPERPNAVQHQIPGIY